jgi:1-pyrroline-5-carboxylate dehydrogenase
MAKFKITYSGMNADLTEVHKEFDAAMVELRKNLGAEVPSIINGKEIRTGKFTQKLNPANTSEVIAKFHAVDASHLDEAFSTAKAAQKKWSATAWTERVKLIRKAAEIIRDRKMKIAGMMTLEVGKNRMESLGDAEESADLLDYYAQQMEDANGFIQPLGQLSPNEHTQDVLRPFGVFAVIAPFNFPMALAAGMSSAALLGGNSVILKPSDDAPGTAHDLYLALRDAGIPEGTFQVVYGNGPALGEAMVKHSMCDGVAFTGSKNVGLQILKNMTSGAFAKPVLAELGGKNAAFVCETANLDQAALGCMKSAFGLSGQKCSALSRLYVHESIYPQFIEKLVAQAKTVKIGDPAEQENYMGPVINARAVDRHLQAITEARQIGKILSGGNDLREKPEYKNGHFAEPTIAEVPRHARHLKDEFFSPFLAVTKFTSLSEAIEDANKAEYGLTSGIFSGKEEETTYFLDHIEAGVLYVNRAAGATTGAWPGVQSFCGWKGSGLTGKGGCGPYYVAQFMREQSRTIVR